MTNWWLCLVLPWKHMAQNISLYAFSIQLCSGKYYHFKCWYISIFVRQESLDFVRNWRTKSWMFISSLKHMLDIWDLTRITQASNLLVQIYWLSLNLSMKSEKSQTVNILFWKNSCPVKLAALKKQLSRPAGQIWQTTINVEPFLMHANFGDCNTGQFYTFLIL